MAATITTLAQLREFINDRSEIIRHISNFTVPSGSLFCSAWAAAGTPGPGVAPTTAAVPTRSTAGAVGQRNKAGGALRRHLAVLNARNSFNSSTLGGPIIIVDRLSHQGGLSGNINTVQTTNLPTAALTRYTDGIGVWAGLEIYSAIGTTGTNVSASYTNSDGTAGRTTPATPFGVAGYSGAHRVVPLPVQIGDKGVKSVESVTLGTASGTVGNFGVTLFKTLGMLGYNNSYGTTQGGDPLAELGPIPEIKDDACIQFIVYQGGQTANFRFVDAAFFDSGT